VSAHSEAIKRSWAQRKSEGWKSAAVRHEERILDDLRKAAQATTVQARFGRDLVKIAEWLVSTCLAAGSSVHTAYLVAGEFTAGLSREWAEQSTEDGK
jgi:hypothetical protein